MDRHFPDQASLLRMLARQNSAAAAPRVPLAVIFGAEKRVGVTTLVVNLGAALAESGRRVAIVDLDFDSAGLAQLCGIEAVAAISDLASMRVDLHESLLPGAHGSLRLPTTGESLPLHAIPPQALQRLTEQLQRLGRHADLVLIDAGSRLTPLTELLWRQAERFVLAACSARSSLTAGYAAIRQLQETEPRSDFGLLLNRVSVAQSEAPIIEGFDRVCRRHAGAAAIGIGAVRHGLEIGAAQAANDAFYARYPQSAVASDLAQVAKRFAAFAFDASTTSNVHRAA
ncbi:MAG: MinD/ParA family protein [Blastopirellula sp. JB062]